MCRDLTCSTLSPCAKHRARADNDTAVGRKDARTSKASVSSHAPSDAVTSLRFGSSPTAELQVLLRPGGSSVAVACPRPIVPGHALVFPLRQVLRLSELSDEELVDLALTLRAAQPLVEAATGATACNVAIRNGPDTGMPVDHLHMHIVPRKPLDFKENDDIYGALASWSPLPDVHNQAPAFPVPVKRNPRTEDQMAAEATSYQAALEESTKGMAMDGKEQSFGRFFVPASQLFYASSSGLSAASVNLKPLCPGHVLVMPRRSGESD